VNARGKRHLARLVVENFQSHRLSEVVFSPGLNVITGRSDEGKSALIRALRWLLYNEPSGASFVRQGENVTRVAVWFDDGTKIVREREGNRNRYLLFRPGESVPQRWEGFGSRVPVEILQAHGMQKLLLDEGREVSLNLADQLEEAFLLTEPATVKAKAIGALTGVHVVDAAIRLAEGEKREAERQGELWAREARERRERLSAYAGLEEEEIRHGEARTLCRRAGETLSRRERILRLKEREEKLGEERKVRERERDMALALLSVEDRVKAAEEAVARLGRLKDLRGKWERLSLEVERRVRYLRSTARLPEAGRLWEEAERALRRAGEIRRVAERWQRLGREIGERERVRELLAFLPQAAERLEEAGKLGERASRIRQVLHLYRKGEEEIRELERKRQACRQEEEEAARSFFALLARAGRCPLCGSPVRGEEGKGHLEEVLTIG